MPSGWDVYYIVFLSASLALAIPASLAVVSYLVSPRVRGRKQRASSGAGPSTQSRSGGSNSVLADAMEANEMLLGQKLNARFFLAANAALVLITLMLALIPCVGMLQPGTDHEELLRTLIAIVTLAGLAGLGLLYSARKSDLGWLKSYNPGTGRKR